MYRHYEQALKIIKNELAKKLGARLVSVYAFGSRVKGTDKSWSDFDLLIIVKDKEPKIEAQIIDVIVTNEIKVGLSFAPVIKDYQAFQAEAKLHSPFYQNIKKEAIKI
jgi:predicted nucleotidyltransferase